MKITQHEIQQKVKSEFLSNLSYYSSFCYALDESSIISNLSKYIDEGFYNNQIGDIGISALCNAMNIHLMIIEQLPQSGIISHLSEISHPPSRVPVKYVINLLRYGAFTGPEHYDALVENKCKTKIEQVPSDNITNTVTNKRRKLSQLSLSTMFQRKQEPLTNLALSVTATSSGKTDQSQANVALLSSNQSLLIDKSPSILTTETSSNTTTLTWANFSSATATNCCTTSATAVLTSVELEAQITPEVEIVMPSTSTKHISVSDIGLYVAKTKDTKARVTSDNERYHILTSAWIPSEKDSFPRRADHRSFQYGWLSRYQWMVYSREHDGVFCKNCAVFAVEMVGKGCHQKLGGLVTKPFDNWKHATETFDKHGELKYHKDCIEKSYEFIKHYGGKAEDIRNQINNARKQQVIENRNKLVPIIETIIFCARQEIALRGHRDYGPLTDEEPPQNDGNFRAALRLRLRAGDFVLASHLQTTGKNATYLSWKTQNEIIEKCGGYISETIVGEIGDSIFTVIADETTDISGIEQFSISVRYLFNQNICEKFLGFIPVYDTTGYGLATALLNYLRNMNLNLNNLRGQAYDGASAMSGKFGGVQAEVKKNYPLAMYLHCSNHILNLAIAKACELREIQNALGVVQQTCVFLTASAKRLHVLKKTMALILPGHRTTRLKKLCTTRWVERHDAVITFVELLYSVVKSLEEIEHNHDKEASIKARSLSNSICDFKFLVALFVLNKFSTLLLPISCYLQSPDIDLMECCSQVKSLVTTMRSIRKDASAEFSNIFSDAAAAAAKQGVDPSIPRRVGRQINRANYETDAPVEYYKIAIFIPYCDFLIQEVDGRFQQHENTCLLLQHLLPSFIHNSTFEKIKQAVNMYASDLPGNEATIQAEYMLWMQKWAGTEIAARPRNSLEAIDKCTPGLFPNILKLLQIFAILPVSAATAERSFSTLRRLKTYLRSTTGEKRLNGLALMCIHRNIQLPIDSIIDRLAKQARKLDFVL